MLGTLYLRKETRIEKIGGESVKRNIVAYYWNKTASTLACINPHQSRPTRRNKYVMLNCNKYAAEWLPDAE